MAGKGIEVGDAEKGMNDPAVPNKHFGRFHEALAGVAVE
jgi:hypothetical protein